MTAQTGTRRGFAAGSSLFLAAFLLALAACRPAAEMAHGNGKRVEAKWEARQLLIVGDDRTGIARIFHTRAAPSLIGELRAPGRKAVRDIRIDEARGRIWVLGDAAVYLHDARSWTLIRSIPAPVAAVERLVLDGDGAPQLLAEDGSLLARINPAAGFSVEHLRLAGG